MNNTQYVEDLIKRIETGEMYQREFTDYDKKILRLYFNSAVDGMINETNRENWTNFVDRMVDNTERVELLAIKVSIDMLNAKKNIQNFDPNQVVLDAQDKYIQLVVEDELFDEEFCERANITLDDINALNRDTYFYLRDLFFCTVCDSLNILNKDLKEEIKGSGMQK